MKQNHTENNSTILQLKMPVDMERIIKITDSVYSFSEVMAHIDLNRYFVTEDHRTGRPTYDRETLLKIVLFAFMEFGYCSVRRIHALCETDIRFIWLLDEMNPPSVMTIQNFIHKELSQSLEDIFTEINAYIFEKEQMDTNHIYIDGTKRKANAGNYTWVWKKSCIKSRNKIFTKMTELLSRINEITRMNRSIHAEGTFGTVKWNRSYSRLRRRGTDGVLLELGLVSCGFNLHKYHLKKQKKAAAA